MKKFIHTEKNVYILVLLVLLLSSLIISSLTQSKLHSLQEIPPLVIHYETTDTPKEETVVFVTAAGEKYHIDGCKYSGEKSFSISLESARASGYTACKYCITE